MDVISFFGVVTDFFRDLSVRYPKFQIDFWVIFGFLGQAMFTMRFVVQWIASEKRKESVIPVAFWYFSLAGGLILLAMPSGRWILSSSPPIFSIPSSICEISISFTRRNPNPLTLDC